MKFTDKEMLDWLEEKLRLETYTGKCVFRWSSFGKGFRLQETSRIDAVSSVRAALGDAMWREQTGKGGER